MAQDFSGGMGSHKKMQGQMDDLRKPLKAPAVKEPGKMGEEKTHTITEHADGSMTSKMHDGAQEQHPDHLHMLAHVGHHITGGDKHHISHHDGMSLHSHSIDEGGQHQDTHENASPEEAGQELASTMGGDEGQPPAEKESEPAPMGGMA
jgi:hypothetical protein